jgi:hypothetical protein
VWVRRRGGTRILRGERSSSSSLVAGLGVVSCNALVGLVSGYGPDISCFRKPDPEIRSRRHNRDATRYWRNSHLHTWYVVSETPDGVHTTTNSLQPLRPHPKVFQVLVKTHKLTIFLALPNVTAISTVKEQVLSAFSDDVFKGIRGVPSIRDVGDFVLSREVMERGRGTSYEVLTDNQLLREIVSDWAVLFIQFKNESGASNL